jgi:hypothetical protein
VSASAPSLIGRFAAMLARRESRLEKPRSRSAAVSRGTAASGSTLAAATHRSLLLNLGLPCHSKDTVPHLYCFDCGFTLDYGASCSARTFW